MYVIFEKVFYEHVTKKDICLIYYVNNFLCVFAYQYDVNSSTVEMQVSDNLLLSKYFFS